MVSVRAALHVHAWAKASPRAGAGWTVAAVAVATALAAVAATVAGRSPFELAAIVGCAAALTALGVIDVRTRRIPNRLIYPALGLAFVIALVDPERSFGGALAGAMFAGGVFTVAFYVRPGTVFDGRLAVAHSARRGEGAVKWAGAAGAVAVFVAALAPAEQSAVAFAAAAVAGAPFLPSFVAKGRCAREDGSATLVGRGVGGGDVKLAALLGAVAGGSAVLTVLPVAVFGGAVAALTHAVMHRGGGIPYAPFLAAATMLVVV